jgi:hypothetical protein
VSSCFPFEYKPYPGFTSARKVYWKPVHFSSLQLRRHGGMNPSLTCYPLDQDDYTPFKTKAADESPLLDSPSPAFQNLAE